MIECEIVEERGGERGKRWRCFATGTMPEGDLNETEERREMALTHPQEDGQLEPVEDDRGEEKVSERVRKKERQTRHTLTSPPSSRTADTTAGSSSDSRDKTQDLIN